MKKNKIKYHLITADFEKYDFNKLFNEESDNDKKILWKIGSEGGKYAQKYDKGDKCYIYYGNLPDGSSRILLSGIVNESDTDENLKQEKYSYDETKKIKGIWLSKIQAIALDEPDKFNKFTLAQKYNKRNIQGQQYLWQDYEMLLVNDLEKYSKGKNLKAVRKYFDDYTRCFFEKKDKNKNGHVTFTSGRGLNYYEKHHFVLRKYLNEIQEQELINNPNNIIHLCPTCHRKIHHADAKEAREMIELIYKDNKEWYDKHLKEYAQKDQYTDVFEWILHVYDSERKKNNYQTFTSL